MKKNDPRVLGNPGIPSFRVQYYPFYQLNRAVGRYNPMIAAALKPVGIDVPTWRVLMILGEATPRAIGEIAEAAVIHISTMTRIIRRMENAGLIRCTTRSEDHRVTDVHLTPLGERKTGESRQAVAGLYALAIQGFSRPEFEQLVDLLNRLHQNLMGTD